MGKIIVTGANGFLGLNLIKILKEQKFDILAFLLKGEDPTALKELGVPCVFGNVLDKASLSPHIQKGDAVVHLAAIVSITGKNADLLHRVNVDGTANVLQVAQENGAEQFVYVSSVHAIPPKKGEISETDFSAEAKNSDPYEESKIQATKMVLAANRPGFVTSVIYPSGILGPGDAKEGELSTLIKKIAGKKFPFYVSGGYAFVDVRDVSLCIASCLKKKKGGSFVASGGYLSLKGIIDAVIKAAKIKYHPVKIPRFIAYLFLPIINFFQSFSKKKPLYTLYSLQVTAEHPLFETTKAEKELGVNFRDPRESVFDQTRFLLSK